MIPHPADKSLGLRRDRKILFFNRQFTGKHYKIICEKSVSWVRFEMKS